MTRKITSINEMCQCPLPNCHSHPESNIQRCISYGPLTLYNRNLKKEDANYSIRACEYCALDLMTKDYSIMEPETE